MPSSSSAARASATSQIQVDDVFENTTRLAAPYRIANDLHISTHDTTVQQQLLFHTGDVFDRRVLDETARLLRAQRYLNEATVEPVRYNEADNTVDVLVRVHDVWTLSPGLSFGRKGGENSTRVKFEDTNFLGLGKQLSLARSSDVDRTAWELGYVDPNVFGSWWKLSADYSALSDGSEKTLSLERPFYALDTRWSAGFSGADATTDVSRYSLGHARRAASDAGAPVRNRRRFLGRPARRLDDALSRRLSLRRARIRRRSPISRSVDSRPTASSPIPGSASK